MDPRQRARGDGRYDDVTVTGVEPTEVGVDSRGHGAQGLERVPVRHPEASSRSGHHPGRSVGLRARLKGQQQPNVWGAALISIRVVGVTVAVLLMIALGQGADQIVDVLMPAVLLFVGINAVLAFLPRRWFVVPPPGTDEPGG